MSEIFQNLAGIDITWERGKKPARQAESRGTEGDAGFRDTHGNFGMICLQRVNNTAVLL